MINDNEYSNSSDEELFLEDDKLEKKIFPVYNENNMYITKEIVQSILQKGNINKEINNIQLWQQAFIHKSYCENIDFKKK